MNVQPAPKRMPSCVQVSLLGHVGEGAVAVVAVELVLAVVGEKQIFEAVVVVVANADADGPAGIPQARFFRHVFERAVAIVLVEPVRRIRRNGFEGSSAEDEDVHPAVVVVVEEGAAAAHLFDDVGNRFRNTVVHLRGQARACGDISERRKRLSAETVGTGVTAGAACAARRPRGRTAEAQRAGAVRSSFRRLQPEVGKFFVIL